MCCALFSMMFLLRRSRIRFNRDWFMRLCGLMLDLLFIAALSKAYPKVRPYLSSPSSTPLYLALI